MKDTSSIGTQPSLGHYATNIPLMITVLHLQYVPDIARLHPSDMPLLRPLCEKTMSSAKPEEHNVLQIKPPELSHNHR